LPITTLSQNDSDQRQLTQELRFATSGTNKIDFVAGLFGYRQTIRTLGLQEQGAAANLFTNGPTAGANAAVLNGLRQTNRIAFENNSLAAYGQLTWNLSDTLRIQPGLRLNYDTKDASYDASVTGGIANPTAAQLAQQRAALPVQFYTARFRGSNLSGDVNVSWRPADDVLIYGVYSRSFKSGGINLNGLPFRADNVTVATELATVRPERVDHFEAGVKSQFWGKRLTLNLTAYHTKVKDYQTSVSNGAIGIVRGYLANADVRIQGVEAEFSIRPTRWLSAYFNAAYNDGIYSRFPDAPIAPENTGGTATSVDISGARFPGVSKWALAWGGEATLPIGAGGAEAYVGADASYRSSYSSNATPSPYFIVDAWSVANFRIGFRNDGGLNVFGWVRNAFDAKYLEFLSNQPGNNGLVVGQLGDPRTFGVTVAKKF
jgi:iron complex outermembrane recepter protein